MGSSPPKDPMVIISPRFRCTMPAATICVTRSVAVQLTVMMLSISSFGVSTKGTGIE